MPSLSLKQVSPLGKLAAWAGLTGGLALLVQAAAWLVGADFQVMGSSGTLLALALGSLLVVMAADQRDIADYGFIVGPVWKKLFFRGAAIGAGVHLAFLAAGLAAGVFSVRETVPSVKVFGKAWLNGMTAMPLSATQQILFSGYLLTMLRDKYKAVGAVLISAALFALLGRLDKPQLLLTAAIWPMLFSLFLTATLLGLLRLRTGSILTSAGVLAGWIFVRRFTRRAKLLTFEGGAAASWLAPQGDVRLSPVFWGVLAAGIGACLWMLWRHGEKQPELDGSAIDADFKRVFPLSNGASLAPLDLWLGRLWDARFRVGAAYLPRTAAILLMSSVNTLLSLPERLLLPLLLRRRPVTAPLFILGTHRSGTTHLHNMLSLDPQFCCTRTYHIMNPVGCVFTGWLVTPLLGLFLPYKRPMDGVRFHLFSPQEEEFAVAGSSPLSPYWGATFPQRWPHYDRYIFPQRLPEPEQRRWRRAYHFFLQKLTIWTRRRPLLKNPYNTGRLPILRAMYPAAQFVHIRRHPAVVYQSNLHMSREAHVMNQIQDPVPECSYGERFLDNYREMEECYAEAAATLPPGVAAEVRFEAVESDPIGTVQAVYRQLGLEYSEEFDRRLRQYLETLSDYRKNRHRPLSPEQRAAVEERLTPLLQRWGYALDPPSLDPPSRAA